MARKNRRIPASSRPLPVHGSSFYGTQEVPGPSWAKGHIYCMRIIGASAASKFYLCPHCNQEIYPGTPHIVAWPRDFGGPEDRRHWHRGCWERR